MSHWSKVEEQAAGYKRLKFLLILYRLFGRAILQVAVLPAVLSVFLFSKKMRDFSFDYWKNLYEYKNKIGDKSSMKPNMGLVFKHFYTFADSLADKVASWEGKIPLQKMKVQNQEVFDEFVHKLNTGQGTFLICSHLGNIEVFRALGNLKKEENNKKTTIHAITQIAHSPFFNQLLGELHPEVDTNLISAVDIGLDTVVYLKEKLEAGDIVVTAGDRTAALNEKKSQPIQFLGKTAHLPLGAFTLATLMRVAVYFVFLLKTKDSNYNLYIFKSAALENTNKSHKERQAQIELMIKEFTSYLETLCLEYPFQWYNFFDFWKEPKELPK